MGWITIVFFTLLARIKSENQTCKLIGQTGYMEFSKEGDLMIGGIFSMTSTRKLVDTCRRCVCRWNDRELRFARTMIFTVEEINRDNTLLPGVSLGYRLYNGCGSENLIRMKSVKSICEKYTAMLCLLSFFFLFLFSLKVSHLSTCACLSDKRQYPTFFRTVPSDRFQITGLVQLMKYFDWRWVGIIYSTGLYSEEGTTEFVKDAGKEGICVEYSLLYSKSNEKRFDTVIATLRKSSAKVVLLFMSFYYVKIFLAKMETYNITGKQWVGTESWITQAHLASVDTKHILQGAMGFALPQASIPGLGDFLLSLKPSDEPQSDVVKAFWEKFFDCSFSPSNTSTMCTGTEDLRTFKFDTSIVLEHIKYVNFTTVNGAKVSFDENGDSIAQYDLVNWQMTDNGSVEIVNIGQYDTSFPDGEKFKLKKDTKIVWGGNNNEVPRSVCREPCPPGTRKAINKNKPVCCFDCFECPEGTISNQTNSPDCLICPPEFWPNEKRDRCLPKPTEYLSYKEIMGALLTGFGLVGVFLSLLISVIFLTHKETPIVRANNSELSFLLLLSLKLCFLCSLTFIGQPTEWSCMLRHTAFGITFVLCISCVLGKTIVVLMAFKATLPGRNVMKWFGPAQQRLSVLTFTLIQVVICILWLTINPPFPFKNMNHYKEKIILECALGSPVGFWAVLGYIGLLAVLCFILAFLARKLPDSFNEAKLITFSMLIFCAVWITFIPAYVSSPGKFTVAVEIFAILASSFGLLVCIFVPKCYIIIFRPEQNSKKHLMGKIPPRTLYVYLH
uniref:Extracellular calcium-sensing receptor-like n=1 Tax=Stegastes partitus TaxID=144197 RepID=A0A3B5BL14_9TELE